MHTRGANQSEIYFNQSLRNCKYFQHISPVPESDSLAMRCDPKATTKATVNGAKIIANAWRAGKKGGTTRERDLNSFLFISHLN